MCERVTDQWRCRRCREVVDRRRTTCYREDSVDVASSAAVVDTRWSPGTTHRPLTTVSVFNDMIRHDRRV